MNHRQGVVTPEQATLVAAFLELHVPANHENAAAFLSVRDHLREMAGSIARGEVRWSFDDDADVLRAADPGRPYAPPICRPPAFTRHVERLLHEPFKSFQVEATGSRQAVNSCKARLIGRLRAAKQDFTADVIADITLRQDGPAVIAEYRPVGVPVALAD